MLRYDLETGKLQQEIKIPKYYQKYYWAFNDLGDDSLFVLYNAYYQPDYLHDSCLIRFNTKGEIQQVYSFVGSPVIARGNSNISLQDNVQVEQYNGNLKIKNKKLYVPLASAYLAPGDVRFTQNPFPLGLYFEKNARAQKINAHHISELGVYYSRESQLPFFELSAEGNPTWAFTHTHRIVSYDMQQQKVIEYKEAKTVLCDSIYPLINPAEDFVDRPQLDPHQISYKELSYNPYGNYYIRFVRQAMPTNVSENEVINNPIYSFIILDKDLKKQGEGILPKELSNIHFFTKEGICFLNKEKTEKNGKLTYSLYNWNHHSGTIDELTKQLKSIMPQEDAKQGGLNQFVNDNFFLPQKDKVVCFIAVDRSCQSCIGEVLSTLYKRCKDDFNDVPVYFILAAYNSYDLQYVKSTYNINYHPHILYDEKGLYLKYVSLDFFNPKILVYKKGQFEKEIPIPVGQFEKIYSVAQEQVNSF